MARLNSTVYETKLGKVGVMSAKTCPKHQPTASFGAIFNLIYKWFFNNGEIVASPCDPVALDILIPIESCNPKPSHFAIENHSDLECQDTDLRSFSLLLIF